jgi:hypothetical protein
LCESACPAHSTSPPGSTTEKDCACDAGYYARSVSAVADDGSRICARETIYNLISFKPNSLCCCFHVECHAGTYSVGNQTVCTQCAAGKFGTQPGSISSCTDVCPAGYYCPSGSATPQPCPAGLFFLCFVSWSVFFYSCLLFLLFHYILTGSYGSTTGLGSPSCSGLCPADFYCPEASINPNLNPCPSHSQSQPGSSTLEDCACARGYRFVPTPGCQGIH